MAYWHDLEVLLTLDTAGRIISFSSGLASAQIFNPAIATQASLPGGRTLGIMIILQRIFITR